MPVQRIAISTNQLAELLGVEAKRFRGLEPDPCFRDAQRRDQDRWWIVLEPEMPLTTGTMDQIEARMAADPEWKAAVEREVEAMLAMQTSKTMPQLNSGGKKIGGSKGGKKGC